MVNKRNWLGILAIVLIFGMMVVGCDDGSTDDGSGGSNQFIGTWIGGDRDGDSVTLVCTATNWTATFYGGTETGTYTYSGNTVTFKQGTETFVTATLSGNTLTVIGSYISYTPWTLTKQGTSNPPGGLIRL
ncbi:MAG: hypothetical protein LBH20_10740 [Treponema sp.]|jgi:hypothetical protein|nr:hypothetical protein [Treponema sp.]